MARVHRTIAPEGTVAWETPSRGGRECGARKGPGKGFPECWVVGVVPNHGKQITPSSQPHADEA